MFLPMDKLREAEAYFSAYVRGRGSRGGRAWGEERGQLEGRSDAKKFLTV